MPRRCARRYYDVLWTEVRSAIEHDPSLTVRAALSLVHDPGKPGFVEAYQAMCRRSRQDYNADQQT